MRVMRCGTYVRQIIYNADAIYYRGGSTDRTPIFSDWKSVTPMIDSDMSVKVYSDSYGANGATVTAVIQGHSVGIKIRGAAAVELGTANAVAILGIIKELIPVFAQQSDIISRTVIATGIYGQLRIDRTTGAVAIGYTTNTSGIGCAIPKGTNFYIDTSFIL